MSSPRKPRKNYREMTPAELEAETTVFDKPLDIEKDTRPLTPEQQARFERFRTNVTKGKAPVGRPKVGEGAKIISISIEGGLLEQADAYAKVSGVSRSELIATGLRLVMKRKAKPADE
jgi:hypothetical protein